MVKNTVKQKIVLSTVGIVSILIFFAVTTSIVYYKLGDLFFGDVDKLYNVRVAEWFYERATSPLLGKVAPYAHHQLSRSLFIQGNLDRALLEADRELEVYPDHVDTEYIRGLTYGYLGRTEEAKQSFDRFIQANPNTWAARNDKAWLQFRVGDIEGAYETMEPVASYTANPWVQNTLGTILLNLDRKEEAREAFLKAQDALKDMDTIAWGSAYPGNDPHIYETGLNSMKQTIDENLKLLE